MEEYSKIKDMISEFQLLRLKGEIEKAIERISLSIREENEKLKIRIKELEEENQRLKKSEISSKYFLVK